jgi:predicted nucleic acid-binding protein
VKRVFLDASCWVAAVGSPNGGSSLILKLARAGRLQLLATKRVLQEAEENIQNSLPIEAAVRFYTELGTLDLDLAADPGAEDEQRWSDLTAAKDLHVLAGAYLAGAGVLVSLDRRHLLTEKVRSGFPIPVMDTRAFFQALLSEEQQPDP